ncbi:hypothetical protein [Streptococcus suis]|uniref:hypothetical protein n=1 Tax=Streptococcus suis TaxID=1307 RepID=UPI000C1A0407|nr:hypothetical protein [Streptococcus suis]
MKHPKILLSILMLIAMVILVACGSKSSTSSDSVSLSGTYSYRGETFYDESEDEELTIYYELEVNDKKSTYDIVAMNEDGEPKQYFYSETVTIDEGKHIIKDYKGNEFEYSATENSITLPDLAGDTGDEVTLTKE